MPRDVEALRGIAFDVITRGGAAMAIAVLLPALRRRPDAAAD